MITDTKRRPLLPSLTRIADFHFHDYEISVLPRENWEMADYVLGEIIPSYSKGRLELTTGREMIPAPGDNVIGALGTRAATLEAVGDWRAIGDDGIMDAMTAAGLIGRITSRSQFMEGSITQLKYLGHLTRNGAKVTMGDFVNKTTSTTDYNIPTVLIIGTSMSSGKTISGRIIVRLLAEAGLKVVGAKLTGAGRYRDILAFYDSGAAAIFDFVDSGLPSTVCSRETYDQALENLLGRIKDASPDVVVAEAGASPLEPYNGDAAVQRLQSSVKYTVLCASDPYAIVGVTQGFGFQPDLVTGVATATTAGCQVVERLTGLHALNLLDQNTHQEFTQLLQKRIGF